MPSTEAKTKAVNPDLVEVKVMTSFLPGQSYPEEGQYTFAYTITISNHGKVPVQLLNRHWLITDANEEVQEVRGEGVIGEQPVIEPGRYFRYTSGTHLATPVGFMQGSYEMMVAGEDIGDENDVLFEVPIPAFTLSKPDALH